MLYINRLDAHHKLYISLLISLIVFLVAFAKDSLSVVLMATWMGYALSHLTLSWITILSCHPTDVQKIARMQDSSRTAIFIFVVGTALVSLFVVILLMKSMKELFGIDLTIHTMLTILSVVCSWWLVHTLFVFRYAHLFYSGFNEAETSSKYVGGLIFPEEDKPDYLDFTYFSFVIGMTFQVSDVAITSKKIRRLAWLHGVISFVFNTVIVALSINIISSLIQK